MNTKPNINAYNNHKEQFQNRFKKNSYIKDRCHSLKKCPAKMKILAIEFELQRTKNKDFNQFLRSETKYLVELIEKRYSSGNIL
jgi:hypothetical protein